MVPLITTGTATVATDKPRSVALNSPIGLPLDTALPEIEVGVIVGAVVSKLNVMVLVAVLTLSDARVMKLATL